MNDDVVYVGPEFDDFMRDISEDAPPEPLNVLGQQVVSASLRAWILPSPKKRKLLIGFLRSRSLIAPEDNSYDNANAEWLIALTLKLTCQDAIAFINRCGGAKRETGV